MAAVAATSLVALSATPASAAGYRLIYTTPGTSTWTVPEGVNIVTVGVYGAQGGGGGMYYGEGGLGARVAGTFRVSAGQVLTIVAAGQGTSTSGGYGGGGAPGLGFVNGLREGWDPAVVARHGYGGGGASRISLDGQLLVVAGGGGGGAFEDGGYADGGASGQPGGARRYTGNGAPGGAGTATAPGAGGSAGLGVMSGCGGTDGIRGQDGNQIGGGGGKGGQNDKAQYGDGIYWHKAWSSGGGGGGGGYFGGGGGGTGAICWKRWENAYAPPPPGVYGSGGGGGGSNYLDPSRLGGMTTDGVRSGDGLVEIVYEDVLPPKAAPVISPAPNAAGWNNTDVTVTWNWSDPEGLDILRCTTTTTLYLSVNTVLSASCRDRSSNLGIASLPVSVKIDKVAPTMDPTFGATGVTWHWADPGSGLDASRCPPTSQWVAGEPALVGTCFDVAGNATTITLPRHG